MKDKDTNPYDLKVLENEPKDYLDTDDFSKFLKKKNISVREDNLPRFADTHGIKMANLYVRMILDLPLSKRERNEN